MTTFTDKMAHHLWRDAVNLILGIWLALSPTMLGYMQDTAPAVNATLVGIVVAVMAAWLIVSPFLLGYTAHASAIWNQVITGVLIGGLALWTAATEPEGGAAA